MAIRILFLTICLSALLCGQQASLAVLSGRVLSSSGGPVEGATVTARDLVTRRTVAGAKAGLEGAWRLELPAGKYEIHTLADDGIRVFIDDKLQIDSWTPAPVATKRDKAEFSLVQGSHNIRVEYFQVIGPARLQFGMRRLID